MNTFCWNCLKLRIRLNLWTAMCDDCTNRILERIVQRDQELQALRGLLPNRYQI